MTPVLVLALTVALAPALPASRPPSGAGAEAPVPGAGAPAGGAPRASEADRRLLAEILARPEYRRDEEADPAALRRALAELWARVLELLGTAEAERWASAGRALFLAAAAAAAALGLAALRRRGRAHRGASGAAPDEGTAASPADASAAHAEAALRAGHPREAVRHALLAALAALERTGRLPRGRAMTNAEIARAVEGEPATPTATPIPTPTPTTTTTTTTTTTLTSTPTATATPTAPLTFLAALFDRAFYGGQPVSPGEAEAAVRAARRVAAPEVRR